MAHQFLTHFDLKHNIHKPFATERALARLWVSASPWILVLPVGGVGESLGGETKRNGDDERAREGGEAGWRGGHASGVLEGQSQRPFVDHRRRWEGGLRRSVCHRV